IFSVISTTQLLFSAGIFLNDSFRYAKNYFATFEDSALQSYIDQEDVLREHIKNAEAALEESIRTGDQNAIAAAAEHLVATTQAAAVDPSSLVATASAATQLGEQKTAEELLTLRMETMADAQGALADAEDAFELIELEVSSDSDRGSSLDDALDQARNSQRSSNAHILSLRGQLQSASSETTVYDWLKGKIYKSLNSIAAAAQAIPSAIGNGIKNYFDSYVGETGNILKLQLTWLNNDLIEQDQNGNSRPFRGGWNGDRYADSFRVSLSPVFKTEHKDEWKVEDVTVQPLLGKITARQILTLGGTFGFDLGLSNVGQARNNQNFPFDLDSQ
ncbi:MAG: hypothetical protein AAFZ92_04350, partial [Pseudomonadota bacterium]